MINWREVRTKDNRHGQQGGIKAVDRLETGHLAVSQRRRDRDREDYQARQQVVWRPAPVINRSRSCLSMAVVGSPPTLKVFQVSALTGISSPMSLLWPRPVRVSGYT